MLFCELLAVESIWDAIFRLAIGVPCWFVGSFFAGIPIVGGLGILIYYMQGETPSWCVQEESPGKHFVACLLSGTVVWVILVVVAVNMTKGDVWGFLRYLYADWW